MNETLLSEKFIMGPKKPKFHNQERGKLLVKAHPGFSEKVCEQEETIKKNPNQNLKCNTRKGGRPDSN